MKIKNEYVFRKIAEEQLLIPTGTAALTAPGLVIMSESAGMLYQELKKGCSRERLVEVLLAEYDISKEIAENDVDEFLSQLEKENMLEE